MGDLITKTLQFLADLIEWGFDYLYGLLIDLVNFIIIAIAAVLDFALGLLPSPTFDLSVPSWLATNAGQVSWFFPLGTLATCIGIAAAAGAAYFPWKMITKFFHLQ